MKFLVFFLVTFFWQSPSWSKTKLCSGVILHGDKLKFDDTEKRMVCGDKKVEAYQHIPPSEASVFMTGFLQSRGYLNPKFENKNDVLHVEIGRKSKLKKIVVITQKRNLNKVVRREVKRLYYNRVMNTQLLNSIEAEALKIARGRGYPCAKVQAEVNSLTDTVTIIMSQLPFHVFGEYEREKIKGLQDNALERYYPFKPQDTFNEELLRLTEKRIVRSEVMAGTYFLESCTDEGKEFSFEQRFLDGPPRTIRFGAGASTEVGPMVRARWNHNRYKSMASKFAATAQASLRNQTLNFTADSFFWKNEPRRSLLSQAEMVRDSQYDYEQTVHRIRSQIKWTRDGEKHFKQYILGPVLETGTYHTTQDSNTKSFSNMYLAGDLSWMNHKYELFDIHPQEGDMAQLKVDLRHPSLGFTDPLAKFDSNGAVIGRLANSGRGTIVGASRIFLGTTFVSDDVSLKSLPPEVKFYGGGSDDLRGFLLQTLPKNDGDGALTKAELKLELRRTYLFKPSLEAFAFFDQAFFGEQSMELDPRLWYAPGIGLRWLSPVGMVQSYLSHGYATKPYEDFGYYFYVGLGGVF